MTSQADRREAVYDLVYLRRPLKESLALLSAFAWSSQETLATVVTRDISNVLDEFEAGRLGSTALSDWAEAVHGREDIGLDPMDRDFLADALFHQDATDGIEPGRCA